MIAAAAVLCALLLFRFGRRARLGLRVRALGGVRLRTTDRIARAVSGVKLANVALGALTGFVGGGPAPAYLGACAGALTEPVRRLRARNRSRAAVERQLPDSLRAVASALRAGRNVPQALESARDEAPEPIRRALDHAVRRLDAGASVDDALSAFERSAGSPTAASAAETLRIGRSAGANLPAILDVAVASIAERERIARDRHAGAAQARLSAAVVGAMPVAFFVLAGSGARAQLAFLTSTPLGWSLLAAGVALQIGGALWMRALLR